MASIIRLEGHGADRRPPYPDTEAGSKQSTYTAVPAQPSGLPHPAPHQVKSPKYSMPLNTSSTLNIQLMMEQSMSGMKIQPGTHSAVWPPSDSPVNHSVTLPVSRNANQHTANAGQPQTIQITASSIPMPQQDARHVANAMTANNTATQIIIQPGSGQQLPDKGPQRQASMGSSSSSGTGSFAVTTQAEVYSPRATSPGLSDGDVSVSSPTSDWSSPTWDPTTLALQRATSPTMPERHESESDSARGSLGDVFSQEDTRSNHSLSSGGARSDTSWDATRLEATTFDFSEPVLEPAPREASPPCYVAMVVKPGLALMLRMTYEPREAENHDILLDLLADITNICWREIQRAKNEIVNLTMEQLSKIRMSDGRLSGDHLADCSQKLATTINLNAGIFRRFPDTGIYHVANYLYEIVKTKGACSIGKSGVVISLKKRNKYAPVEAFSEQLCEHIAVMKPQAIGKLSLIKTGKSNPGDIHSLAEQARRGCLLPQAFLFDQTILVADAAKRSFVDILDFAYFY